MSLPPSSVFVRVILVLLSLAVVASGVNLIRTERAVDHAGRASPDVPTPQPIQTDMSGLSPAAKSEAITHQIAMLQRQLDAMKREQAESARARAARRDAQVFLQISLVLLVVFLAVTMVRRRRAIGVAEAAATPREP